MTAYAHVAVRQIFKTKESPPVAGTRSFEQSGGIYNAKCRLSLSFIEDMQTFA